MVRPFTATMHLLSTAATYMSVLPPLPTALLPRQKETHVSIGQIMTFINSANVGHLTPPELRALYRILDDRGPDYIPISVTQGLFGLLHGQFVVFASQQPAAHT